MPPLQNQPAPRVTLEFIYQAKILDSNFLKVYCPNFEQRRIGHLGEAVPLIDSGEPSFSRVLLELQSLQKQASFFRNEICCSSQISQGTEIHSRIQHGGHIMKGLGRHLLRLAVILVLAAALGHVAATRSGYAQAVNGTLLGTITDSNDAVVPGATVTCWT
jgi:hypothetical protein